MSTTATEKEAGSETASQQQEDVIAGVTPCQYLHEIYNQPVILFEELGNRVAEFLRTPRYNEVPPYSDIPLTESYKMFLNAFNEVPREKIFNPPENIADYAHYLSEQIPQKACFQIANSWPPAIPRITNTVEPTAAILIKIVSEAPDPTKLLRFFAGALFPKVWTNKPTANNSLLLAASPCKFKGKGLHWAYIVRETNEFTCVGWDKKTNEFVTKAQGIVTSCSSSKNKETVIVKSEAGRICDFTPYDPEVVPLWTHLYKSEDEEEEQGDVDHEVPFPYFFTRPDNMIPDIVYTAFYETCTSNDLVVLRTCLELNADYRIVDALLTIALHSRKIHTFFASIVSYIFENDNQSPMDLYVGSSFYRRFIQALFTRFAGEYVSSFLRRLILLIDAHASLDEKLFMTVIKYITMSSQYIPIQVRHFASILREYASAKFNSRGFCYLLLGGFFGLDFICPILAHPHQYIENLELKNPNLVRAISKLLQFVFHGAILPDQFAAWNKRVIKHVIPTLEEFLFSIGDIADELPAYSAPSQEKTAQAVSAVFYYILCNAKDFRRIYDSNLLETITYTPQIGWNMSCAIGDFFRQYYDRGGKRNKAAQAQRVKPPPLKFPQLPMYGVISAKKLGGGVGGGSYAGEAFDGSSFGLPARERDLGLSRGANPMRLPLKPRNQDHNPLRKDLPDDEDLTTISDAPVLPVRNRDVDQISYQKPPQPPKMKVSAASNNVSATETFSISDTTDDDGELQRGKQPPNYMDTDDNKPMKKRKKTGTVRKITIKESGINDSNAELVQKKEIIDGNSKIVVKTKRKTPRGPQKDDDSV